MERTNFKQLEDLTLSDLITIEGGGLTELTEKIVECTGFVVGWLSTRNWGGIPAHKSALNGPCARPTG